MVFRLIKFVSKADRILKKGLVTGNFNIVAQPRYSDFRRILSQSSVYLSHEPQKTFHKLNRNSNGDSATMEEGETTEKKRIDQRTDNDSSTSPPKSPAKSPNQDVKSGGNAGEEGDRNESIRVRPLVEFAVLVLFAVIYVTFMIFSYWWQKTHEKEITWKDFADNYMSQGRVANVEIIDMNWLRVHTAPGTSADGAKTFRLRLDSLGSYKNVVPETETLEVKVERKNDQ